MPLEFHQFPYGSDNYGVLVHDGESGETAAVDAGDAAAYLGALQSKGWTLTQIWVPHHHADHVAGLSALKKETGAEVYGPAKSDIPDVDHKLSEGDQVKFAGRSVAVLETPGHTLDMINFHLKDDSVIFTGDTLFAMGCGRLFEGDAHMMWDSLAKFDALPDGTVVYCSHEYTMANAAFALSVEPENVDLVTRAKEVEELRSEGKATVPTTLGQERATNPFLRAGSVEEFARRRTLKDKS